MSTHSTLPTAGSSALRLVLPALLGLLGVAGAAAQDVGCAAFEVVQEEARAAYVAYRAYPGPAPLDAALDAAERAEACAGSDSERAAALNYLTAGLLQAGREDEALARLEVLGGMEPARGDSSLWVHLLRRQGQMLLSLGRYVEAHRVLARATGYATSLPLDRRLETLLFQAETLGLAASYREAIVLLESVEHLIRAEGSALDRVERDYYLGRTLWNTADVLRLLSSRDQSERPALLRRSLRAAERALDLLDHQAPHVANERVIATLTLAATLEKLGRTEEAERQTRTAAHAADASGNPSLRAEAWLTLGEFYVNRGDATAAFPPLRQALALAAEVGDDYKAQYTHLYLGRAYEQEGRLAEAEDAYREAVTRAEKLRAALGRTEHAATSFTEWQEPYRRLVGLHLRRGEARAAFALLEQTRARHLHALRRDRQTRARLGRAERARIDSLDVAIERARMELAVDPDPGGRAWNRLAELVAERHGPDADAAAYAPPVLSALQRALGQRGQVLLSYVFGDASYVFVVTPSTFEAVQLPVREADVDSLVQAIGPLWLGQADAPLRQAAAYDTDALHALYRALFAPVRDRVEAGAPLVVVPDGRLREVPFAMLLEAPTPRFQYADAPFLLYRHPITVDLAAALLTDPAPAEPEHSLDLLAFGRSEFGRAGSSLRHGGAPLPDLPAVRAELDALDALFQRGKVALDSAASESALQRWLPEARVIHLASHAAVDLERPLYSYIELWPDSVRDGRLYLFELARHHLPAELVVLSGCSTARGQVLGGEGMLGLHYGFRAAGTHASVGTLWHVDDEAASALMARFYRHLRAGLPKDRALQQAQLDYLRTAEGLEASPFFWAAPVLYGDPAPVRWSAPSGPSAAAWVGLGGLLLLLGVGLGRLTRAGWPRRTWGAGGP